MPLRCATQSDGMSAITDRLSGMCQPKSPPSELRKTRCDDNASCFPSPSLVLSAPPPFTKAANLKLFGRKLNAQQVCVLARVNGVDGLSIILEWAPSILSR